MVCEKSNELMMRYMDGLLDDFDEMNLHKHLETCDACSEDFAVYTEMLMGFNHNNFEVVDAPEDFAANVMAQIDDINLYFPEKVRNRGRVFDICLFALWGAMLAVITSAALIYGFNEQISTWLATNELHALYAAYAPVADFVVGFGTSLGAHAANVTDWTASMLYVYGVALGVAFGGMMALAAVAVLLMGVSPGCDKMAKGNNKANRPLPKLRIPPLR